MFQNLIRKISRKKNLSILTGVLVVGVLGSGVTYFRTLESIKTSSLLTTGINTCFQRVSQTFTSLMTADKSSAYLDDSFTSLTGDCFAEVSSIFQRSHLSADSGLKRKINDLSSDVHWFQKRAKNLRRLNNPNEYSEEDSWFSGEKSLGNADELAVKKFEDLEILKDKVLDTVEYNQSQLESYSEFLLNFLIGFSALLILVGIYAYGRFQESFSFIGKFEAWSAQILQTGAYQDSYKIEQLLGAIFERLQMTKTKELFFLYHEIILERLSSKSYVEGKAIVESPISNSVEEVIELYEQRESEEVLNANLLFSNVVDLISEKVFTHGIVLDMDIDDDLNIWGKEELLQQVFYNTLATAIDHSVKHNKGRKVIIRSKPLGDTAYIKVIVNGHKYESSEIGYVNSSKGSIKDINLQLTSELLNDIDGKVVLRNLFNVEGELSGSCTEILLRRATPTRATIIREKEDRVKESSELQESKPRLVSVKKGTKKEILQEFRANQ